MALNLTAALISACSGASTAKPTGRNRSLIRGNAEFPPFLPKQVERIQDPFARSLASRIERLPVKVAPSERLIMSSCVRPSVQSGMTPVVLLHGFDRMEIRLSFARGGRFGDLFWKSYIRRPMVLVGPSLGAAVVIDLAVSHPEAVKKLVLIDASVYSEGVKLPRIAAYAGVYILKSVPLRFLANRLAFNNRVSLHTSFDWTNVGRLHCLLPWWEGATVDFMLSGGYNVTSQIKQVTQKTLIIWGELDQIISNKFAMKLHSDMQNSHLCQISDCGHIPHIEKPGSVAELIVRFTQESN